MFCLMVKCFDYCLCCALQFVFGYAICLVISIWLGFLIATQFAPPKTFLARRK